MDKSLRKKVAGFELTSYYDKYGLIIPYCLFYSSNCPACIDQIIQLVTMVILTQLNIPIKVGNQSQSQSPWLDYAKISP
jgi:hypothetical protein